METSGNSSLLNLTVSYSQSIPTTVSTDILDQGNASGIRNVSGNISVEDLLLQHLGPRRRDLTSVIFLLIIYTVVFITGTVGNVCTCIVIVKNHYMQTTTNYYLFSLAISDLLILLRLPHECVVTLESYPWRAGEAFCIFQQLLTEMTSYASILTITAFTVERYIAICKPLISHKITDFKRTVKIIIGIWVLSLLFALPYAIFTETYYYVEHPVTGRPIEDSLQCNIPKKWTHLFQYIFQASTFVFFVFPMTLITVLYLLIAIELRRTALNRAGSEDSTKGNHSSSHSRKVVLRMLVAVVVAFFICWAPFHAQRLFTIYNTNWSATNIEVQIHMFYISGVLYYIGSTVNPVLYNVMSKRYRQAFKETLCCCFWHRSLGNQGSLLMYYSYIKGTKKRKSSKKKATEWKLPEESSISNHRSLHSQVEKKKDSLRKGLLDDYGHDPIVINGKSTVGNGAMWHSCQRDDHVTNGVTPRDSMVKITPSNKVEIIDFPTKINIYPSEKIKEIEQAGSCV